MAGEPSDHQLNMILEMLTLLLKEQMKLKEEIAQVAKLAQKAYDKASTHEASKGEVDSFVSEEQKPKKNLSSSFKTNEDKGQAFQSVDEEKMKKDLAQLKEQLSQVQEHILSTSFQGFTNLLETTGRVENAMVQGLDKSKESSKGKHSQGFVGQEVNISQQSLFHGNHHPNTYPHPNTHHRPNTHSPNPCQPKWYVPPQQPNSSKLPKRQYTPLNQPLGEIFVKLKEKNLLQPREPKAPLNPPYPKKYDPNLHCAYHQGPGHHTDKCYNLRHAIQDLIDEGEVVVGNVTQPNVNTNPLPNHHTVPPLDITKLVSSTLVHFLGPDPPPMPKLVSKHLPQLTLAKDPSYNVMVDLPLIVPPKPEMAHLTLEGRHFKPISLEAHCPVFELARLENPSPISNDDVMMKQKKEAAQQELKGPCESDDPKVRSKFQYYVEEDDEIILAKGSSKHDQLGSGNIVTLGTKDDCMVQAATTKETPVGPTVQMQGSLLN